MSYQIRFTDQINNQPLSVDDNTTNTVTSLTFPGRNTTGYGQAIGENFLHLLENFANTSEPVNPVKGQLWYDTNASNKQLNVYDGTQWVAAGGLKKSGGNQPDSANSLPGDLWVNTDTQQLYLFSGSGWILVGPKFSAGARTGAEPETLRDKDNIDRTVISNYVSGIRVAIFSSDSFQPKSTITGFPTIYSGVTLNASYNGYYGTAEKASKLIVSGYATTGLEADNFLRGDIITNNYKGLNVKNDTGIQIGADGQLELAVDNGVGYIYQKTAGSSLDIRVNNNGTESVVIRVDSQERVGINNTAPQETFDVTGNIKIGVKSANPDSSGQLFVKGTVDSTSIVTGAFQLAGGAGIEKNLFVGGNIGVDGTINVGTHILPTANNGGNIGSDPSLETGKQFSNIYANNIYAGTQFNGKLVGSVKGSVDGSATNLASSTIFEITGDIVSNEIEFDGRTGTNPVTTSSASGNGTIVRLDFSTAQTVVPFPAGTVIVVSNITPTAYRGTYNVITGTTSYVTFNSSATGNQTIPATISPAGTIGNRKRFVTVLNDKFVSEKPELTETSALGENDDFLVSQTSAGQVGLKKIKKNTLFQAMPQMPVGMIVPFAGLTPPMGWLLCDGSEVQRTRYLALYNVVGALYGNTQPYNNDPQSQTYNPLGTKGFDTFRLPDLRGRFALGADNMYNGKPVPDRARISDQIQTIEKQADRVKDTSAKINYDNPSVVRVGSGAETRTLTVNNLPDHEHDLQGVNNGKFGAYSPTELSDTDAIKVPGLGGANDTGRLLRTSGGILTNPAGGPFSQPINIMNPFLALNYIIWTGKLTDFDSDYTK
jgi:microcystin-dependent protein